MAQPDEVPIAETAVPRPVNAYGASKLSVDLMIRDFCRAHGLGAVSLRYFNVAGASGGLGEDHDPETHLIPNILRVALGAEPEVNIYGTDYPTRDGTAVRDYIHIEDLAESRICSHSGRLANASTGVQSRQRQRILCPAGDRDGPVGDRSRDTRARGATPAGRSSRPCRRQRPDRGRARLGAQQQLSRRWWPTPGPSRRRILTATAIEALPAGGADRRVPRAPRRGPGRAAARHRSS